LFPFVLSLASRPKKNDGPIEGRLSVAHMVAPPEASPGRESEPERCVALLDCRLTRREIAPHLGVFTRAERRISRQAPPWEPRDCSRNIARDDLRDVSIAASLPDGHCVVYISTVGGRKQVGVRKILANDE
jgi:hypothetical protein